MQEEIKLLKKIYIKKYKLKFKEDSLYLFLKMYKYLKDNYDIFYSKCFEKMLYDKFLKNNITNTDYMKFVFLIFPQTILKEIYNV